MGTQAEDLYLDLLKKALSYSLWPEPGIPIEAFDRARPPITRYAARLISRVFRSRHLQLVKQTDATAEKRADGSIWPGYADTMIGLKRLENIQFCLETAIREKVEGDCVETGVWRGGACILMRGVLAAHGIRDRKVFVADSFMGLPRPDPVKYPADKDDRHFTQEFLAVSQEEVENNFRKYGLLDDQVVFLKGWFAETLPKAPIEKLAVLRLDGDMYGSTMDALTNLYPKLSKGGFCIIDDYALEGCRKAVDDFRSENGIRSELGIVDWTGRYWRKEAPI
jgi:hypothetical protein